MISTSFCSENLFPAAQYRTALFDSTSPKIGVLPLGGSAAAARAAAPYLVVVVVLASAAFAAVTLASLLNRDGGLWRTRDQFRQKMFVHFVPVSHEIRMSFSNHYLPMLSFATCRLLNFAKILFLFFFLIVMPQYFCNSFTA